MGQLTLYKSSDAGAPTINGTSGALVNALDAILVNGYGAKAAAGWTIAFTDGSFKRVYTPDSGNPFYYRLNNAATFSSELIAYENMTDVDTGTDAFSSIVYPRTAISAGSTARNWVCLADDRTCYLFVNTGDCASQFSIEGYVGLGFGDFYSLVPSDAYNSFVCSVTNPAVGDPLSTDRLGNLAVIPTTNTFLYVARAYHQTLGGIICGRHGNAVYSPSVSRSLHGTLQFPNIDDSVMCSRVWITERENSGRRGYLRGFWHFMHAGTSVADQDTVSGTAELAYRDFLFIKDVGWALAEASGPFRATYMMETSATVETNA